MTASSDSMVKRAFKKMGGWLYSLMVRPGWTRLFMLAAAIILFLVLFFLAWPSVDYRRDPSALAPRSAFLYAETRDLANLFAESGTWPLWTRERRLPTGEPWTQLQVDFAGMVGRRVEGLGTRLPLSWLNASKMAAVCLAPGDNDGETSWALYLDFPAYEAALAEMRVEPDLLLNPVPGIAGVYELSSKKSAGKLYFGVKAPWFVISSHAKLPQFAVGSAERPSFSLAYAGIVPGWPRGAALRGCVDPSRILADAASAPLKSALETWLAPDARIGFSYRINDDGGMTASYQVHFLSEQIAGGGIWPLVRLLLGLAAILVLGLIGAIILCMIGWGGWLKFLAVRSGVVPASAPAQPTLSEAFREDAGMEGAGSGDAAPAALPPPAAEREHDGEETIHNS